MEFTFYEASMRCGDNSDDGEHEVWIAVENSLKIELSNTSNFHTIHEIELRSNDVLGVDFIITPK